MKTGLQMYSEMLLKSLKKIAEYSKTPKQELNEIASRRWADLTEPEKRAWNSKAREWSESKAHPEAKPTKLPKKRKAEESKESSELSDTESDAEARKRSKQTS
jgi:hypothetical protein